jgi:hypothetical protein
MSLYRLSKAELQQECEGLHSELEAKEAQLSALRGEVERMKGALASVLRAAQDVLDAEAAYNRARMTTPWASKERDKTAGSLMSAERTLVLMAKGLPAALSRPEQDKCKKCDTYQQTSADCDLCDGKPAEQEQPAKEASDG